MISGSRDRETIERFIKMYVDRAASEDRGDEELSILPLGASEHPPDLHSCDWEPSKSLTHIVNRGLEHPRRAFCVYLKPLDRSLEWAILGFTTDDKVVFGISFDDEGAKVENLEKGKALLHEMATALEACEGFIGVEQGAPLTGTIFAQPPVAYLWAKD